MSYFLDRDESVIFERVWSRGARAGYQLEGMCTGDHLLYNRVTGCQLMCMGDRNQSWFSLQRGWFNVLGSGDELYADGPLRQRG